MVFYALHTRYRDIDIMIIIDVFDAGLLISDTKCKVR